MIRVLLAILTVVVFCLTIGLIAYIAFWILEKFNKPAADIASLRTIQGLFKVILFLSGTKCTVIGKENIPTDTPVVFTPNHQGIFDIVIAYSLCPSLTGFIAKDKVEKIPFLSHWMKRLYCLFLNRDDAREGLKVILKGIEYLKSGISITVFPEGTRNKEPQKGLLPFKEGTFKLASKSKCPVIPMTINYSNPVIEKKPILRIKKAHVVVCYGEPIYLHNLSAEDQKHPGAYVQAIVQKMFEENQQSL